MRAAPNCDPTPGLKGLLRALDRVAKQLAWIEWCEQGSSYDGERGREIREADEAELKSRLEELESFQKQKEQTLAELRSTGIKQTIRALKLEG